MEKSFKIYHGRVKVWGLRTSTLLYNSREVRKLEAGCLQTRNVIVIWNLLC